MFSLRGLLVVSGLFLFGCSSGIDNNDMFELSDLNKALLNQYSAEDILEIQKGTYSFQDLEAHGYAKFPLDTVLAGSKPSLVKIDPSVALKCHQGEMDLVKAAKDCNLGIPLIATLKDAQGEKLAANFGLLNQLSYSEIVAQLKKGAANLTVHGDQVDILMCLDSNHDGRCADEKIFDINLETEHLMKKAQDENIATASIQVQGDPVCIRYSRGVLLYHSQVRIFGERPNHMTVQQSTAVKVKGILNNLAAEASVVVNGNGEASVTIPVPMVEYSGAACVVHKRTNGCFAKGTEITMADKSQRKIESLHVGESVLLANGKASKILKIVNGPEKLPLILFTTTKGEKVQVTSMHPMETEKGVKAADQVAAGDLLRKADGSWVEIKKIQRKQTKELVYNFELGGTSTDEHLIVSNGLVTGELFLQNQIAEDRKLKAPFYLSSK